MLEALMKSPVSAMDYQAMHCHYIASLHAWKGRA